MTTCTLIAGVISCTITGPTPTPAESAAVLAPNQYHYVAPPPPGPSVIIVDSSPTSGPFGEFKPLPATAPLNNNPFGYVPSRYPVLYPVSPYSIAPYSISPYSVFPPSVSPSPVSPSSVSPSLVSLPWVSPHLPPAVFVPDIPTRR
jgi:hypothetical protein